MPKSPTVNTTMTEPDDDIEIAETDKIDINRPSLYIWTDKIEKILDKMRINCVNLSEYHIYKYRRYKRYLMMFRIPIIILSGANVFCAVGLQSYITQEWISAINSLLSLFCGILTSIELFLNIQKKMESDLISHKDYYRLSIDIYKVISLESHVRKVDGKTFLDQKFSEYEKLIKGSNVFDSEYIFDTLASQMPVITNNHVDSASLEKYEQRFRHSEEDTYYNKYKSSISSKLHNIKLHRDQTAISFYKELTNTIPTSEKKTIDNHKLVVAELKRKPTMTRMTSVRSFFNVSSDETSTPKKPSSLSNTLFQSSSMPNLSSTDEKTAKQSIPTLSQLEASITEQSVTDASNSRVTFALDMPPIPE